MKIQKPRKINELLLLTLPVGLVFLPVAYFNLHNRALQEQQRQQKIAEHNLYNSLVGKYKGYPVFSVKPLAYACPITIELRANRMCSFTTRDEQDGNGVISSTSGKYKLRGQSVVFMDNQGNEDETASFVGGNIVFPPGAYSPQNPRHRVRFIKQKS